MLVVVLNIHISPSPYEKAAWTTRRYFRRASSHLTLSTLRAGPAAVPPTGQRAGVRVRALSTRFPKCAVVTMKIDVEWLCVLRPEMQGAN